MSFIRPDLAARVAPWREVIAAGLAVLAGLWLGLRGGWLPALAGLAVTLAALGWAVIAFRRMRFLRAVSAPGMVETDEGQVGYFGPTFGGFVALADLAELRLIDFAGARHWRLRTADGQVLVIPVTAFGAEKLFDAFSALPGLDSDALVRALDEPGQPAIVWTRTAAIPAARPAHHDLS